MIRGLIEDDMEYKKCAGIPLGVLHEITVKGMLGTEERILKLYKLLKILKKCLKSLSELEKVKRQENCISIPKNIPTPLIFQIMRCTIDRKSVV